MKKWSSPTLIVISIVWGTTFWISKDAMEHVSAPVLVGWRFLIAAGALIPAVIRRRGALKSCIRPGGYLGMVMTGIFLSQAWSLNFTDAANAGFITGLFLLFVPLIRFLVSGAWITLVQCVSMGLSLAGLWILTGGIQGVNRGDLLALFSAVLIAAQILLVDRYAKRGLDPVLLNFFQFMIVGVLSLGLASGLHLAVVIKEISVWPSILYLAFLGTVFCFFGQIWAQRHTDAMKATFIYMLEPLSAAIFAWTLGREQFSLTTLAGGMLILGGIVGPELRYLFSGKFEKNSNPSVLGSDEAAAD